MSSSVFLEYNKNDFFYVNAREQGLLPTSEQCESTFNYENDSWANKCNPTNFTNNGSDCIKKELCKNKTYAEKLIAIENVHTGADEKYYNTKEQYNELFMGTINLGIGCLFLGGVIYMNR